MANEKFPRDTTQAIGKFWIPGSREIVTSTGVCRVDGSTIEIEATSSLTPWFEESEGERSRPATESDDLVIHGNMLSEPHRITFFGAYTATRQGLTLPFGDSQDLYPHLHRLRADWGIAGSHVASPTYTFPAVRVRFSHLEEWAEHAGFGVQFTPEEGIDVAISYGRPKDVTAPFTAYSEDATLRLSTDATISRPNIRGSQIRTKNWIAIEDLSGWTLDEAFARFINPVRSLMTILAGERSEILEVEVWDAGRWCAVFGGAVKGDECQSAMSDAQLLLRRDAISLEHIGKWCATAAHLSPTPYVLEAALAGSFQTVEVEALELTTTAEGMDSALHPDSRRFSAQEVTEAKSALKKSDVSEDVRNELSSALGLFLYKDTYPIRMKRLATDVMAVAPNCVGDPNVWKSAMRQLRNGLAHSNRDDGDMTDESIVAMDARSRSLRWALQIRLLQHAGVSSDVLNTALSKSSRFNRDVKVWEHLFGVPK